MKTTNKLAFTMLELVFVIVVLGIITSLAIPRIDRDHLQDAAVQILQDIRYTQHLALMDDKTDPDNTQWQRRFWTIRFGSCDTGAKWFYAIGSDNDSSTSNNAFSQTEAAIDPLNGLPMFGTTVLCNSDGDNTVSNRVYITKKFGISNIDFTECDADIGRIGTNNSQHIGFDYMGRPHKGYAASISPDYSSVMQSNCTIEFTMSDAQKFKITIEDQTGRAFIVGQDN